MTQATATIVLTKGFVATVDADDAHLGALRWHAHLDPDGTPYAIRNEYVPGQTKKIRHHMHREIAGATDGFMVDHINGDTLDNRRANLRIVTQTANRRNVERAQTNSLTGLLGVSFEKARGRYRARIWLDGKNRLGPLRVTKEEAHMDRLRMEQTHFGIQPRRRETFAAAGLI